MKEILNYEIEVSSNDRVKTSTSSKGNQIKWCKGNLWVKADDMGYEGLSEAVSSRLLSKSNIPYFVEYSCCIIKEVDTEREYIGCYSKNFLGIDEEFITLNKVLSANNINIDKQFMRLSTEDRIRLISDLNDKVMCIEGFNGSLSLLLQFDRLILNEDRHFNNIGVVYNNSNKSYKFMPVFDNGLSLLSDTRQDYPLHLDITKCLRSIKAKPFNSDFNKQVNAMNKFSDKQIQFDMSKLIYCNSLERELYSPDIINRVNYLINLNFNQYRIINTNPYE